MRANRIISLASPRVPAQRRVSGAEKISAARRQETDVGAPARRVVKFERRSYDGSICVL